MILAVSLLTTLQAFAEDPAFCVTHPTPGHQLKYKPIDTYGATLYSANLLE